MHFRTCIFDLDGVITDTSHFHFLAWKRLAKGLDIEFDELENENLKGVSRKDSLLWILNKGNVVISDDEFEDLMVKKNEWYLEFIQDLSPKDAFEGAREFIEQIRVHGLKTSVGSSSKNARLVLDKLELTELFDGIADGTDVTNSKPAPDIFLLAASKCNTTPKHCIVFEDSTSGIEAALTAKMFAVGVGEPQVLSKAHLVIPSIGNLDAKLFLKEVEKIHSLI